MTKSSIQDKILPIMVVALIGAAFSLGMMWGRLKELEKDTPSNIQSELLEEPEGPANLDDEQQAKVLETAAHVFGAGDAKVTLVEFTDYGCSWCGKFYTNQHKQIIEKYVDNGQVKYVIQDKPSFENSQLAARVARCAGSQDKYLEMHDLILEGQLDWNTGIAEDIFIGYASDLELDSILFNECLESEEVDSNIDASLDLAGELGVVGTPTFYINGEVLVGAAPIEDFIEAIDKALEN